MTFIEPPYITESVTRIYVNKNSVVKINTFKDIYRYIIGVTRGYSYFEAFDNDEKIKKHDVVTDIQLLKMLELNRIDAFVSPEISADYLIKKHDFTGKFNKCSFRHNKKVENYIILSKKSRHLKNLDNFNRVLKEMVAEGRVQEIVNEILK